MTCDQPIGTKNALNIWYVLTFHDQKYTLGSAINNLGLFSKSPGDFKMETMDF